MSSEEDGDLHQLPLFAADRPESAPVTRSAPVPVQTSFPPPSHLVSSQRGKTRLPEDWVVPAGFGARALGYGLTEDEVEAADEMFATYFWGTGKMMLSWEATWLNWMRREATRKVQRRERAEQLAKAWRR